MADETKNVFISHIHEDDEGLAKLKELLKNNGLTINDYSINAENSNNATSEEYIKSQILAPRIQQCSTKDSEYVNWEIECAQSKDKRVGWTRDNIIDAIVGKMDRWESPDGAQCQPRQIKRYSCG
jgi:hypothetical protein